MPDYPHRHITEPPPRGGSAIGIILLASMFSLGVLVGALVW